MTFKEFVKLQVHMDVLNAFIPKGGVRCNKDSLDAWMKAIYHDVNSYPDKYNLKDNMLTFKEKPREMA